ncbi:Klc, partial [Symbiodinium sp. KB8]
MCSKNSRGYNEEELPEQKRFRANLSDAFLAGQITAARTASLFKDAQASGATGVDDWACVGEKNVLQEDADLIEKFSSSCQPAKDPATVMPLGLWNDGVPCNWDRSQSLEVLALSFPSIPGLRVPLFCLKKMFEAKKCSMDAAMKVLVWSFEQLVVGRYPSRRHDGSPFDARVDKARIRLAGLDLPSACLTQIRGDWKMFKDTLSLTAHNENNGCCWICPMTPDKVHEVCLQASWRLQYFDQEAFIMRCWKEQRHMSAVWQFPGFCLKVIRLDGLHIMDLGCAADVAGNVLWLLQSKLPGPNIAKRVGELCKEVLEEYKNQGVTSDRLVASQAEVAPPPAPVTELYMSNWSYCSHGELVLDKFKAIRVADRRGRPPTTEACVPVPHPLSSWQSLLPDRLPWPHLAHHIEDGPARQAQIVLLVLTTCWVPFNLLVELFSGLLGAEYTAAVEEIIKHSLERNVTVFEHPATGIRVWSEALDLRAARPGCRTEVLYHYTTRESFSTFLDHRQPVQEALKSLCYGEPLNMRASSREPNQLCGSHSHAAFGIPLLAPASCCEQTPDQPENYLLSFSVGDMQMVAMLGWTCLRPKLLDRPWAQKPGELREVAALSEWGTIDKLKQLQLRQLLSRPTRSGGRFGGAHLQVSADLRTAYAAEVRAQAPELETANERLRDPDCDATKGQEFVNEKVHTTSEAVPEAFEPQRKLRPAVLVAPVQEQKQRDEGLAFCVVCGKKVQIVNSTATMSSELALSYDERLVYPDEELFEEDFERYFVNVDSTVFKFRNTSTVPWHEAGFQDRWLVSSHASDHGEAAADLYHPQTCLHRCAGEDDENVATDRAWQDSLWLFFGAGPCTSSPGKDPADPGIGRLAELRILLMLGAWAGTAGCVTAQLHLPFSHLFEVDDKDDDGHDRSWEGVRYRMVLLITAGLACTGLALWALYSWQFPAFSLLQEARSFSDSLVSSLISNLPVEVQGWLTGDTVVPRGEQSDLNAHENLFLATCGKAKGMGQAVALLVFGAPEVVIDLYTNQSEWSVLAWLV